MLAGLSYTFLGDEFCVESQFLQDLLSPLVSAPFCSLLAGTSVARLVTERLVTSLSEGCKTDTPHESDCSGEGSTCTFF